MEGEEARVIRGSHKPNYQMKVSFLQKPFEPSTYRTLLD